MCQLRLLQFSAISALPDTTFVIILGANESLVLTLMDSSYNGYVGVSQGRTGVREERMVSGFDKDRQCRRGVGAGVMDMTLEGFLWSLP
jgi:hypothetical protein